MSAVETITMDQLPQLADRLGLVPERIDWRPCLKRCAVLLRGAVLENFRQAKTPQGVPWPPLKRPRSRSKGKDIPLHDTGVLRASATSQNGQGHVEIIDPTRLEYGSNLDYAAIHNNGGVIQMPARKQTITLVPAKGKSGALRFARKSQWAKRGARSVQAQRGSYTVRIPQRQFVGVSDPLAADLEMLVSEFLEEEAKK